MEETINTSGFYKNDNGTLSYGPNFILNKDYELRAASKDQYAYPVDGWSWFESEQEAISFFGLSQE